MAAKTQSAGRKGTQQRVQEIADELAQAAGRVRDALDDARPATAFDLESLRAEVGVLAARVDALESAGRRKAAVKPANARKPAARKSSARGSAASKVPAARAAAKRAPKRPASS